ncbi:MAG: HYR domain-containing protein, partial [Saprospiraceae bacterium]
VGIAEWIEPEATDNCNISGVTQNAQSGDSFPLGETVVTYTASDSADPANTATCSFTVTVAEKAGNEDVIFRLSNEVATCPSEDVIVNLTTENYENIAGFQFDLSWDPAVLQYKDILPGSVTINPDPTETSPGVLPIRYFGNAVNQSFPSQTVLFRLVFTINPTATDTTSTINFINEILAANEMGETTDVFTVNGSATYPAIDRTPPTFTSFPNNIVTSAEANSCSVNVPWTVPTAEDDCGTATLNSNRTPNTPFDVGSHTVTYTATDDANNTATRSFTITVNDTQKPTISCPLDVEDEVENGEISVIVNNIAPSGIADNCAVDSVFYRLTGDTVKENKDSDDASGESFNIGTTTVTYIVIDESSNRDSCSFNVVIMDNSTLEIECPGDQNVNIDANACNAMVDDINVVVITPSANNVQEITWILTGDTEGSGTGDASGTEFNIGTTRLTYTVTTNSGLTESCFFLVTVNDNVDPQFTGLCPPTQILNNDAGECGAFVIFDLPAATDNCANPVSVTSDPISGSLFPIGTTEVIITATDDDNNTVSCSFRVTVNDSELPTITCPADITRTSDTPVVINGIDPVFSDNCSGAVLSYSLSGVTTGTGDSSVSGIEFNVGETTVTYGVTDASGNIDFCSFTVTVMPEEEEIPPVEITCSADVSVNNDVDMCSAIVNDLAPTFNEGAVIATVTYTLTGATNDSGITDASGSEFNVGTTTVTYVVTDSEDRTDTCSFTVTVRDSQAPIYTCISDTMIAADNSCMATFDWSDLVSVMDNCSLDSLTLTSSHEAGANFPIGTTEVILTATDKAGNSDDCRFNVVVEDRAAPVVSTCPPDITQTNEIGICGATIDWTIPTFTDNCTDSDNLTVTASHMPNTVFPVGSTTVIYTATDVAGNVETCVFTVQVNDTEAPIFTSCPIDTIIEAGANCEAAYSWVLPNAVDNCGIEDIQSTHSSGDIFPLGTTQVIYSAVDGSGNTMVCAFNVTVRDGAAPTFSCPAEVRVRVDGTIVSDPSGVLTDIESNECADVSLTFNEPTVAEDECDGNIIISRADDTDLNSGDVFPVGTTTLIYTASDLEGNVTTCNFNIVVEGFAPLQIAVNDATPCAGEDVKFVAEDIVGGTYEWTLPDETTVTGANLDVNNAQVEQSGIYTVEVTDANGCRYQGTFDLTVAPQPNLTIDAGDMLCAQEMGTLELMVSDDSGSDTLSFMWTGPNDFSSTEQSPSIENATANNSGTYMVTATNREGCTATTSIEITVADRPENLSLVSATPNEGACVGESIQLIGTNFNSESVTYNWISSDEAGGLVAVDSFLNVATPTAAGTYTYQYFVTIGSCTSDTASVTLIVEGQPEVELAVAGETRCLNGTSDVTLQVTSTGEIVETWLWSGPNNYVSDEQNPVLANVAASDSGMYILTATTNNGCSVMDTLTLEITDQTETPDIVSSVEANCLGNAFELSVPEYEGDVTYQWSADATAGLPTDFNAPTIIVTPTTAGDYNYILTVIVNGCPAPLAEINIPTEAEPELNLSAIPTELDCVDGTTNINLSESSNSGTTYTWTTPSGVELNGNNATINNVTSADAGIYTVTVATTAGCEVTESVNISITDALVTPQVIADIDLPCATDNVQLSVANPVEGATYEWTGPGNYKSAEVSPILNNLGDQFVGEYFVTVTKNGCTSATSAAYSLLILDTPDLQDDNFEAIVETPITVDVLQNDILIEDAEISVGVISSTFNGKLENNQDGTFTYTPGQGTRGFDQFVYQICYTDCKDNCEIATVAIETKFAADECVPFNIISPNGDGQNDEFVISCVDGNNFPNNSLLIMNQWGDEVFRAQPYQNNWRGTHDENSLPDGTYYYIFIPETGRDAQTGFITIQR